MIRSSACQRQADPFPALSGRHGERRSYTTSWDTIRPMIVFVFADCDPAGYQMAVSISQKLRAFSEGQLEGLQFEVHPTCLTVDQVRQYRLPSTPLKKTEQRADGWRARYGVEQTEIDALATLRPDLLNSIAEEALDPFYDWTLNSRVRQAAVEWQKRAQTALDEQIIGTNYAEVREKVVSLISELSSEYENLRDSIDDVEITFEPFVAPEPELSADKPKPLVSTQMPLSEHCAVLKDRKDYGGAAL